MLPSARHSLERGGLSETAASWFLIVLFLGGAVGIQVISRIMHHLLPSHVVDCDHTHEDEETSAEMESCPEEDIEAHPRKISHPNLDQTQQNDDTASSIDLHSNGPRADDNSKKIPSRPRPKHSQASWNAWLASSKSTCDSLDCYGYSQPCGNCFKNLQARTTYAGQLRPNMARSLTEVPNHHTEQTPLLAPIPEYESSSATSSPPNGTSHDTIQKKAHEHHHHDHHHHVPTNAFLSIGLQTSIAIALHKLPEGFITYATNHANPRLGVAVFLSLFIHNLVEGLVLAVPLYLAFQSRPKAMFLSAILGGASQPLGAGIAALWFHLAGSTAMAPGEAVYGGMFALVAGIMTSVALQLMGESLELSHDRGLCITFAFIGMGILGVSSALTA
jgi:zinc transporter, ZIP family